MSWLWSASSASARPKNNQPSLSTADIEFKVPQIQAAPAEDDDESDEDQEDPEDADVAPAFPALNSAQRAGGRGGQNGDNSLAAPKVNTEAKPTPKLKANRKKVALQPGFSQLDWFNLKNSGADLREGESSMRRITLEELSQHKSRASAWSAFNGRVYNITPYIGFHPGGAAQLMRVAGKDGTELFMKTHAWVNVENMMDSCCVGMLVRSTSSLS